MVAQFGGAKDATIGKFLLSFAQVDEQGGGMRLTLEGKEAQAFRLGLRVKAVSQRLLSVFLAE